MNTPTEVTILKIPFWLAPAYRGAFWKIISCAAFAGINTIVRYLGGGANLETGAALPTNVIVFFQNAIGMLILLPFLVSGSKQGLSLRTAYPKLHLLRIVTAVLGVALWYLTLRYMSIAEGVALTFTGPVFTVLGAWFLLGERLSAKGLAAVILSVIGAYIIARPDAALMKTDTSLGIIALLPLGSALAFAWNKLLTRQLGRLGEKPKILTLYLLLGMGPISLIPALFDWVTPSSVHWPWLIGLGILGLIANTAFGKAYALAEVTFLTPFGFSKFLFSMALGYYCFAEFPAVSVWIGLSIIGISICLLVYRWPFHKIPLYSTAKRFKSN